MIVILFRGAYCGVHKLEGMHNLKCKSCEAPGCQKFANFSNKGGGGPYYCNKHKLGGNYRLTGRQSTIYLFELTI